MILKSPNKFSVMYTVKRSKTFLLLIILFLPYTCVVLFFENTEIKFPKHLKKFLMYEELPNDEIFDVNELKRKIKDINKRREVRNWKKFGPVLKGTTILLVQVHKDIKGLQHLVVSLAQVRYIESVLVIFSHSYYSEHINRLIRSIDFCKVMQIFYPHSVQLHPDKFPGIDPEDCISGSQTTLQLCQQRDAPLIERKHHWWWKANFVFDQLEWSFVYNGTVIFIEEDQYVTPDLLHMLQFVQRSLSFFPDVEIMSFGKIYAKNLDYHSLTLRAWRPTFDVGIAFNKTTWSKIVDLSSFYCMFDDCSWSYSLLNVFKNFPRSTINMVACVAPRIITTKQFDCMEQAVSQLSREFHNSKSLFPDKVKTIYLFGPNGRVDFDVRGPLVGTGGWTNMKDQLLCLEPLNPVEGYEATAITSRFDEYTG